MITQHFGGSWRRACRSLWGLQADGRYTGASRPWDNVIRGRPRVRYSEQECLDALRRCAQRFNRVPTTSLYIR